jgi:hypothetical protein
MKPITNLLSFAMMVTLAGCEAEDFPVSYLNNLRLLAIEARPLEAGPDESVIFVPKIYLPPDETLSLIQWSFCPFSPGAVAGYVCAIPQCEETLVAEDDGSLVVNPHALILGCINSLADISEQAPGIPEELPQSVEVLFSLILETDSGFRRQSVFLFPVYLLDIPEVRNSQPKIDRIEINGQRVEQNQVVGSLAENEELDFRVVVDPASLDVYSNPLEQKLSEEVIVSYYSTAGRFAWERDDGLDVQVKFKAEKLEPDQIEAGLYAVIRDLRGGQTVFGPVWVPLEVE